MKPQKIAITFHPRKELDQTWFGSGIGQNIKFYFDLFRLMGHDVTMIVDSFPDGFTHKDKHYDTCSWGDLYEGKQKFDIVLEAATNVGDEIAKRIRTYGTKIIGLRCANQLTILTEGLFLGASLTKGQFTGGQHVMWILPHHRYNAEFLSVVHQCPVKTVPYLWEPDFLIDDRGFTKDRPKTPDIYVMEPNISTVKHCIVPLTLIQQVYNKQADCFERATILNSLDWHQKEEFNSNVVKHLDVTHGVNNKIFFSGRATFDSVFQKADILLAYQYHNELNYLYNEALYRGISLVHNSPAYKELGYYYPNANIIEGAAQMIQACIENQHIGQDTLDKNRKFLHNLSIHNPKVQQTYEQLLEELVKKVH